MIKFLLWTLPVGTIKFLYYSIEAFFFGFLGGVSSMDTGEVTSRYYEEQKRLIEYDRLAEKIRQK